MVQVHFPTGLIRHHALPPKCEAAGTTVRELIQSLESEFPGVAAYLIQDDGSLRQHVNIFLDERWIGDRQTLSDSLAGVHDVYVMPALSGG
ncbi:MAG: MoaD/ThiS family protein [Planctomycetales bacterium]